MSRRESASGPGEFLPPVRRNTAANRALHPDRPWIRAVRIAVGIFVLAALVQKTLDATLPGNDVDVAQLFSEFTVQGNLALGLVLILSGVRPRSRLPLWWDHLFGALVLYLVMTGIIYVVLVAPPGEPWWSWDLYWPQMVHHRLAPLVTALDWLLVTRTVRGTWWRPLAWLGYPVAFLAFSWIRGVSTGGTSTISWIQRSTAGGRRCLFPPHRCWLRSWLLLPSSTPRATPGLRWPRAGRPGQRASGAPEWPPQRRRLDPGLDVPEPGTSGPRSSPSS